MATEELLEAIYERRDNAIRKEFRNVSERFDRTDAAVQHEFENVYLRFDHVDNRLASVENRLDRVEDRLDRVDDRLQSFYVLLMAQATNPRAASSRDKILPLGIMSPSPASQLVFPSAQQFPDTVIKFWNLHNPRRSKIGLCLH